VERGPDFSWDTLPSVESSLTFIASHVSERMRFTQPPEKGPEDPTLHDTRRVRIHDVRSVARQLSLAREGFVVTSLDAGSIDPTDDEQILKRWVPAAVARIKAETGAAHVVTWAFGSRFSRKLAASERTVVSAPARMVHTDFSPSPAGSNINNRPAETVVAEVAASNTPRRWRCLNVWQAISPPPHDCPLALCDASSTHAEDFVAAYGTSTYESGLSVDIEVCWLKHRASQRWAYVRDLKPGEALIFSGLDRGAGARAGRVAHAAFDSPDCPTDCPPRVSLEVRALAIFD